MSVETSSVACHERRLDPVNHMGLDWHAGRALGRFQHITDLGARREAITNADFRNRGVHAGEVNAIRTKILKDLDLIEGRRTPEQKQLLKMLEAQVETAAGVWTERYLLPNALKKDRLIEEGRKWLGSLPPKTLNGLIELCPETAQFEVVPNVSVPLQIKLIGGKIWWPEGWDKVKSEKWKFGITNGAEDIPFDPAIFYEDPDAPEDQRVARTNEEMVAEYERQFNEIGLTSMPQHGYVPSAANALAHGRVLDRKFYTAFKRPSDADFLPRGFWYGDQVFLDRDCPGYSYGFLRCRPWVEGEMSD